MRDGCPNCESTLQLRGNNDAVQECTSQVFEGVIAVRDPASSWVAKWQRLDNYVPGTYATKVTGAVSDTISLANLQSLRGLLSSLLLLESDWLISSFASTAPGLHHWQSRGLRHQICSVCLARILYSTYPYNANNRPP